MNRVRYGLIFAGLGALLLLVPGAAATRAAGPLPCPPRATPPPVHPAPTVRADFDGDGRGELVTGTATLRAGRRRAGPNLLLFDGTEHGVAADGRMVAGFRPQELLDPSERMIVMDDLVSADVNGDGCADLVYVTATQGMTAADRLMIGYGSRHGLRPGVEATFTTMPSEVAGMAAGDLDGDGRADLVLSQTPDEFQPTERPDLTVIRGGRHGLDPRTVTHVKNGLSGFGDHFAVGDVTGDGRADIVATNPRRWSDDGGSPSDGTPRPPRLVQNARITIVPGTPSGPDARHARYLTPRGDAAGVCQLTRPGVRAAWGDPETCLDGLVLADLTGDHRADLVAVAGGADPTGQTGGDLLVYRSRGPDFAPPERLAAPDGTGGYLPRLAVGDVTGDDTADLAASACGKDAKHPHVMVFTGHGHRRELDAADLGLTGTTDGCAPELALIDHDGDGRADLDVATTPSGMYGHDTVRVYDAARPGPDVRRLPGNGTFMAPGLPR